MATNSLAVARRCIEHLRSELSGVELEGVRSVFVSGSYVRGDWLDGRSDLDIGLVTDCDWEQGFADVQRAVSDVVGEDGFDSHEEGGIDWNLIDAASLPRTTQQAIDSPFPYFSVFRFDLDAHCDILWGDDFRAPLPPVPPPHEFAHRFLGQRAQRIAVLRDSPLGRKRALYAAYKAAVVLQLVHGELTLDKHRMPGLFEHNVPEFPGKRTCAAIIANYASGGLAVPEPVAFYRALIDSCADLIWSMSSRSR